VDEALELGRWRARMRAWSGCPLQAGIGPGS
jgi:hypothetical protein